MNPTYTALIALMRSGEISMESGESLPASSAQFSVRIRPESRVFLDKCAEHLGISRAALFWPVYRWYSGRGAREYRGQSIHPL